MALKELSHGVKIKINGKEFEASSNDLVIKVAIDNGIFIPHFCWHPGLTPEGNCRMCLVKTSTSRKLEPACMMKCQDGMQIETEAKEVLEARRDVLEFLLINHPLDCPVCDKAGECLLQDYTYTWRGGLSRFIAPDQKIIKPTKDLGPNIKIWGNRCVVCTRCVRFLNEISGTGELTVMNRGDRSHIDIFTAKPLDNLLSLNVVDICPVGALIDKNFLYQARVWFAKRTKSICTTCARGCSTTITTLDNNIKRIQPRYNPYVNSYWMCDEGRLNYRYVSSNECLWRHGAESAHRRAKKKGELTDVISAMKSSGSFGFIASSYNTCEEIYLLKKLMSQTGINDIGFLTLTKGERMQFKKDFTIEADKTPNKKFLELAFGEEALIVGPYKIISKIFDDKIKGLFILNGIPDMTFPKDLTEACRRLEFLAICDILENQLTERAHVVLPGCAFAEKDGTFINFEGQLQKIRKAIEPPQDASAESEILQELLVISGVRKQVFPVQEVFNQMTKELGFLKDVNYSMIGDYGVHPVRSNLSHGVKV